MSICIYRLIFLYDIIKTIYNLKVYMINQNEVYNQQIMINLSKRDRKEDTLNYLLLRYLVDNKMYEDFSKFQALPYRVDIEPTTRCFLRCRYCQVPFWDRKELKDLDFVTFKKFLNKMPQLLEVKLQGQGEPLLNEELFQMVTYAAEKNIIVRFNTNGMLLTPEINQKIVQSGLFELRISLDGASSLMNQKMRSGMDYERVIKNIKNLIKIRGNNHFPFINIWTLITKHNYHEIVHLVKLCHEIGVDGLKIQTKLSTRDDSGIEAKVKNDTVDLHEETFLTYLEQATLYAKKVDLDFEVQTNKWRSEKNHCWWLWNSAYISSEGYVVPCCIISNPEKIHFGNILEQDFKDIWFGETYQKFREDTLKLNINPLCTWCYDKVLSFK